jgi:hypothetical protein
LRRKPWYAEGLRFECRGCGSCCGGFPGFVWVTEPEIAAAARHLGLAPEEFRARHCRSVGGRYTLRETRRYDCVMLEEGRCTIYPVRPLQCRTFPFWDENLETRGDWREAARACPGMDTGKLHAMKDIDKLRERAEQ